jgi:Transcription factor WhiB
MPTPSATILSPQASVADGRLRDALVRAATRGERTPCSDVSIRDHWTSDREKERERAVLWCRPCPVLLECRTAAEARAERWYVFGGKDFSPRPYRSDSDQDQ